MRAPPDDVLCPYPHVKGFPGGMTPQKDGTRRCGKCGHTDMPGNDAYVCKCHHCRRKRAKATKRIRNTFGS